MTKMRIIVVAALALGCGKEKGADSATKEPVEASSAVETGDKGSPAAAAPTEEPKATGGRLTVVYDETDNKFRKAIKEEQIFEKLSAVISDKVQLPRDIPVIFTKCGEINAFYTGEKHAIIMCDEMIEYFITAIDAKSATAEEKRLAILGALTFFFLHEVGHAFVNELELPAVGREEDAADQIASLLLISSGPEGARLAGYGADAFSYILKLRGGKSANFWDEHGLDEQRFFNIACLIYGSNPEMYKTIVDSGFLPETRARRCPDEWKNIYAAWDKLLAPYQKKG